MIFVSLALRLQNGAFRRVGGISVHTTYLTGMITSLISAETEKYASEVIPQSVRVQIRLLYEIGIAFVLGAGIGAAIVLHLRRSGCYAASMAAMSIFFIVIIASKARFASWRRHRHDCRGTTRCRLCSTSFSEKCSGSQDSDGVSVMRMHLKTG